MREKEGMALQSNEIMIAISTVAIFIALRFLGKYMFAMLEREMTDFLSRIGDDAEFGQELVNGCALDVIKYCVLIVGPVAIIIMAVIILTVLVQTKGLFNIKALRPKFSRISPIQGVKRLFSLQSLVGIIKGIVELIVIGVIAYFKFSDIMERIAKLPNTDIRHSIVFIASSIFDVAMLIFIVLAFVAAMDFVFQWWQFEKKLKMSKQEVKDEYKQIEGDPQVKSKIKQKQREISQRRMMQEVPSADVVVRNPTHYAVALKYDSEKASSAPVVVAKGMDALALRIISIAEENKVYITENRPLARSLYDNVKLGAEIPPDMYSAVAVVLTEMFKAKGIKPVINRSVPDRREQMKRKRRAMGRSV